METQTLKALTSRIKGVAGQAVAAAVLASVVFLAAPKQAAAQSFAVQFGYGHPYARPYYAPPLIYYGPGYYVERRREEWLRHERWVREHEFRGYPPAYGYYRR